MSFRSPTWTMETPDHCARRQSHMIAKLRREGYPNAVVRDLAHCSDQFCAMDCVEGCHFGTLARRTAARETGLPILQRHAGPHLAVCVVHPLWEAQLGGLTDVSISAAAQWIYRRLRLAQRPLLAVGNFEVSLNVELDGERYWAGELQLIVCGADREELATLLRIGQRYRHKRPYQKMVRIDDIEDLERQFMYAQKRFFEQRIAYTSLTTGRQDRHHLPLTDNDQAEVDQWLLSIPLGGRNVCFGLARRGTTFYVPDVRTDGGANVGL